METSKYLVFFDTKAAEAQENMSFDEKLLKGLKSDDLPILHFYDWAKPSATFGYFINPANFLNLERAAFHRIDLARRPTGGGIVFHIWDLAFSFLMPSSHPRFSLNTLENYHFVNEIVLQTVVEYFSLKKNISLLTALKKNTPAVCQNFCMAKPTQYDVVYENMKVAGAAQRRRKQGYLHQGTISLAFPKIDLLEDLLLSKKDVLKAMKSLTFSPLGPVFEIKTLNDTRKEVKELLYKKLVEKLKESS